MGQITLQIPQTGQAFSTEGPKVASDMTTIQTVINGNLDTTNIAPAVLQSATVNTGGATVKGATSIATSESRTNVAYGTLTTPDQVTGIVLAANGLIAVWYQATWQESVSNAGRAAIFLNSNQLNVVVPNSNAPAPESAATSAAATAGQNRSLVSGPLGLSSGQQSGYTGDVATGQAVGMVPGGSTNVVYDVNGSVLSTQLSTGVCYIFAAAGTYTVSVQFKASSGSVTASNRKLWVQALAFA